MYVCAREFPSECLRLKSIVPDQNDTILNLKYMEYGIWHWIDVSHYIFSTFVFVCISRVSFWCRSCLCCRLRLWFVFFVGKVTDSDKRNYPNFRRTRTRHHGTHIKLRWRWTFLMRPFMGYIVLFIERISE